jgi:hypothetical protein
MWRRTLLENADGVDNTCLVLWIQTDQHHVDIRIPSSRPVFSPVSQLSDYTLDQLKCLADQEGFTGITQVEANIAEWVREQDSTLIEIGVEDSYSECWEKLANSNKNLGMKKTLGKDRHAKKVPARLFTANNIFAYVRPRTAKLPDAKSLAAAIDTYHPSKETLLDWLDFEISFGQIKDKNQGYIMHSTLPFREGTFFDFNMFV